MRRWRLRLQNIACAVREVGPTRLDGRTGIACRRGGRCLRAIYTVTVTVTVGVRGGVCLVLTYLTCGDRASRIISNGLVA